MSKYKFDKLTEDMPWLVIEGLKTKAKKAAKMYLIRTGKYVLVDHENFDLAGNGKLFIRLCKDKEEYDSLLKITKSQKRIFKHAKEA